VVGDPVAPSAVSPLSRGAGLPVGAEIGVATLGIDIDSAGWKVLLLQLAKKCNGVPLA